MHSTTLVRPAVPDRYSVVRVAALTAMRAPGCAPVRICAQNRTPSCQETRARRFKRLGLAIATLLVGGCGSIAGQDDTNGAASAATGRAPSDVYVTEGRVYAPTAKIVYEGTIHDGAAGVNVDGLIGVLREDGSVFLYHTALGDIALGENTSARAVGALMMERSGDGSKAIDIMKLALGESRVLATGVIVERRGTNLYRFTNNTFRWVAIKTSQSASPVFLAPKNTHFDETFIKSALRRAFTTQTLSFVESVDLYVGAEHIETYGASIRGLPLLFTKLSPWARELREKNEEALTHDTVLFVHLNALDYMWVKLEGVRAILGLLPDCAEALIRDAIIGIFEAWAVELLTGDEEAREAFAEELALDAIQNDLGCLCAEATGGACELVTTFLDIVSLFKWRSEEFFGRWHVLQYRAFDVVEGTETSVDPDQDDVPDYEDLCDHDSDGDGISDCIDDCPGNSHLTNSGPMGCDDMESDGGNNDDDDVDYDILTVTWTGCALGVEFDPPGQLIESSIGLRRIRVEDGTRVRIRYTACPGWRPPRDDSVRVDRNVDISVSFTPPADPCAGVTCDDANRCTSDACVGGSCVFTAMSCNDGYPCTSDSCEAISGCVYTAMHCDDSSACTDDFCANGSCVFVPRYDSSSQCCDPSTGVTTVIADANDCTSDICDATTGRVTHTPRAGGSECDDGDPCTAPDNCDGLGACIEAPGSGPAVVMLATFDDRRVDESLGWEIIIEDALTCPSSIPAPDGGFLCLGQGTDLTLRFEIDDIVRPAFVDILAAPRGGGLQIDINGTLFAIPAETLTIWRTHTYDVCTVLQRGSNRIVVTRLSNNNNAFIERIDLRR